ncbi:MAG: conjugal transfer protein TraF [Ignavibacteria bacterium]|nr:conjugal transfer protein TraF [Ignavibacteria bacterium]
MKKEKALMTRKIPLMYLFIICLFVPLLSYASFYEGDKYQGFYYFQESIHKNKQSNEEEIFKPQTSEEALYLMEVEKKRLDGARALAILNPSQENLLDYFEKRNRIIDRSVVFSERGAITLLEHPKFGPEPKNPTTSFGIEFRKRQEDKGKEHVVKKLGETFFLLVVGPGEEDWAELAASIGESFQRALDWDVRFLTTNKKPSTSTLKTHFNPYLLDSLNLEETPAFFMVEPEQGKVIPLGAGAPSVSHLMENILLQASNHALLEDLLHEPY